uniref:Wzx n=1 Tax=Proteus vulgaris TaxID=585 RepID=A0A385JN35_PROVU|nr:wzx [Proteus vulgaris]
MQSKIITFLAITSKIINSFVILKILSIILSESDFSIFIYEFNKITVFQYIFTLGITTGIVAEAKKRSEIFGDVIKIINISLIILPCVLVFNIFLSISNPLIILTSSSISLKLIIFSLLNGINEKKSFTILCTIDSIILLALIFVTKNSNNIDTVFLSYLLSSLSVFFLSIFYLQKKFKLSEKTNYRSIIKKYKNYFLMSVISAFFVPLIYLITKKIILDNDAIDNKDIAILFSAWRLYDAFIMVIGTISSIHYIQMFNKNIHNKLNSLILKESFKITILIFLGILVSYLLFPQKIISLLLTNKYASEYHIFYILFVSCGFRAFSYVIGLYFVIFQKVRIFIFIEVTSSLIMLLSSISLNMIGIIGFSLMFIFQSIFIIIISLIFITKNEKIRLHYTNI